MLLCSNTPPQEVVTDIAGAPSFHRKVKEFAERERERGGRERESERE